MEYKLGSLFDGSGGFPLAGSLCGVTPCWASEVEPYPIAVTRERFPNMKHLGDISKINGGEIEPVDIITFGSPCQDLSVAGKRAGLKHEANGDEETTRSGLFMEAVRIIKEMRAATNGKYPRFALWENVPGAFSSNKGEDFRIVCEELIKIVEPRASMPEVPKNGWAYADSYVGDGWSLAYRTFDAQYWGVPQRRRRIHLIADFRGECAREVLFEREGVRGYFAQGRTPWQTTPADAQGCTGADDREGEGIKCFTPWDSQTRRCYGIDGVAPSLCAGAVTSGQNQQSFLIPAGEAGDGRGRGLDAVAYSFDSLASNSMKSSNPHSGCREVDIAKTLDTTDPNPSKNQGGLAIVEPVAYTAIIDSIGGQAERGWMGKVAPTLKATHYKFAPCVVEPTPVICLQGNGIDRADTAGCNGKGWKEDTSYTLNTIDRPAVVYAVDQGGGKSGANVTDNKAPTLCTTHGGEPAVAYCVADHPTPKVDEKGVGFTLNARDYKAPLVTAYQDKVGALCLSDYKGVGNQYISDNKAVVERLDNPPRYIVRRLTPTECARLQGFADCWGHVEKKDSLTDEEYNFWQEVRNTHAVINGKKVQDYTEKQMLTWYNKLWTDSAEYKMWGNGIALPPALYCLQGIVDVLDRPEEDADDWLN